MEKGGRVKGVDARRHARKPGIGPRVPAHPSESLTRRCRPRQDAGLGLTGLGSRPPNDAFTSQVFFPRRLRVIADFRACPVLPVRCVTWGTISADDHRRLVTSCRSNAESRSYLGNGPHEGKHQTGGSQNESGKTANASRSGRFSGTRTQVAAAPSASCGWRRWRPGLCCPRPSVSNRSCRTRRDKPAAYGRLSANVLERAPWVAGLGWQVSKDAVRRSARGDHRRGTAGGNAPPRCPPRQPDQPPPRRTAPPACKRVRRRARRPSVLRSPILRNS